MRLFHVLLLYAGLAALCCMPVMASPADQFESTCRITSPDGSIGTGSVLEVGMQYVGVLTNEHVVHGQRIVSCEFWSAGHQSTRLPAQVYVSSSEYDAAMVLVPTAAFAGRLPKAIPMAAATPKQGEEIRSTGCPLGGWPSEFSGHVTRYDLAGMWFLPPPANGRSGSAIVNSRGELVALLRARAKDNSEGLAVDLQSLRQWLTESTHKARTEFTPAIDLVDYVETQCGPNGCPAPSYQDDSTRFFLRRPQQPSTPYPTMPAPAPQVDLSPIGAGLDRMAEALGRVQSSAPSVCTPDPATLQAINQLTGQVQQHGTAIQAQGAALDALKQDVPKAITAAVQPVADQVGQVAQAVKPLMAIHAKLEADAEEGGLKGKLAQKILDKIDGQGGGDDGLRKILITAGIVLAIVLLIGIAVIHTIRTGKGPAHELIEKLAAKHPDNAALQTLDAKLGALDAKISAAGHGSLAAATAMNPALAPVAAIGTADNLVHKLLDAVIAQQQNLTQVALATPAPTQQGQPAAAGAPVINVGTQPAKI